MKILSVLFVLSSLFVNLSFTQCVLPPSLVHGDGVILSVEPSNEYTNQSNIHGSYKRPKCAFITVQFSTDIPQSALVNGLQEGYFRLYEQKYDCGGNPIGNPVFRTQTSVQNNYRIISNPILVEENSRFYIERHTRRYIDYGFFQYWSAWKNESSHGVRFSAAESMPTADGWMTSKMTNGIKNYFSHTKGWIVPVAQINNERSIDYLGYSCECALNYNVTIEEFDIEAWNGVGPYYTSQWNPVSFFPSYNGSAVGVSDLASIYSPGFVRGKIYHAKLAVTGQYEKSNHYSEKSLFFEISDPVIDIGLTNVGTYTVTKIGPGKNIEIEINEVCEGSVQMRMFGNGLISGSIDERKVDVCKLNTNFDPVQCQTTGYVPNPYTPSIIYLSSIWGANFLASNDVYKVTYWGRSPETSDEEYFKVVPCFQKSSEILNVKKEDLSQHQEYLIFPNPSNGRFIVKFELTKPDLIQVYDVSGKLIRSYDQFGQKEIEINLKGEKKGQYLVNIIAGTNVKTKRLILN